MSNSGLYSIISEKIDQVIVSLQSWKRANLSLYGRVNVVKSYALSKLSYFLHIDWPLNKDVKRLDNAIKWFLWTNTLSGSSYDPSKSYRSRMNYQRLAQTKLMGGLKLDAFQSMVDRYKAWPMFLAVRKTNKNFTKHVGTLLLHFDLVEKVDNLKKIYLPKDHKWIGTAIQAFINLRSITPALLTTDIADTKNFFKLVRKLQTPDKIILTESQINSAARYNFNWKTIWKRHNDLETRAAIKAFQFKVYNNALNWFTRNNYENECHCRGALSTFWHICHCPSLKYTRKLISDKIYDWFQFRFRFSRYEFLKSSKEQRFCFLRAIAYWILWRVRNKLLYEGKKPVRQSILFLLKHELERNLLMHLVKLSRTAFKERWSYSKVISFNALNQLDFDWF